MAKEKSGFFARLKEGLAKTRNSIVEGINSVFMGVSTIDDDFYEELEEVLIMSDLGVSTSEKLMENLREEVETRQIMDPAECKELLIDLLREEVKLPEDAYAFEKRPAAVMFIGVNGVGKTTTIGKLAAKYKQEGKKVLLAACDTFRAAAIDQLREWSNRAGVPMISQAEGADPSAVAYDAVNAAVSRGIDMLLCDTAGRLHNKKNLMEELRKMNRVIDNGFPGALRENLLVLDATTGQNAIHQAKEFQEVCHITGIVLTKMDGTAKGGIAIAIKEELGIPVKYICVGEQIEDLERFDPDEYIDAIFES